MKSIPLKTLDVAFLYAVYIACISVPGLAVLKTALILFVCLYFVATRKLGGEKLVWAISVGMQVGLGVLVGVIQGVDLASIVGQSIRILIFFAIIAIGWYAVSGVTYKRATIDNMVLATTLILAIIKLILFSLVFSGYASMSDLKNSFDLVTTTGGNIGYGLPRIQFPSDIALIFLVVAYTGGRNLLVDLLFVFAVVIIAYLAFSRYIFVLTAVAFVTRSFRLGKLDVIPLVCIAGGVAMFFVFFDNLQDRFYGVGTTNSDDIRTDQVRHLLAAFLDNPVFGLGAGSHAPGFLRNTNILYLYEVQWYALLMQFGLIGMAWMACNIFFALKHSDLRGKTDFTEALVLVIVTLVWIGSGLTNPLALTVGAAAGFCILFISSAKRD